MVSTSKKDISLKKFLIMIGGWLILVIGTFAGLHLYKSHQGSQFEAKALPFLDRVIPIISEWDADKTRDLLAPEALAAIPEEKFGTAMSVFSKLGALQNFDAPQFEKLYTDESDGNNPRNFVTYKVDARYTNADAQLQIQLIDRGDTFQVFNFNLSSEYLLQ